MNEAEYLLKNMEIDKSVIRRGHRPRRKIPPSEISIILLMIRKPHSIIVLLFIQNNSQFKSMAKHAYLHRSIEVKFIFDSARLALLSSANVLQIADVALRVVFCCSCHVFSYFFAQFLLLKRVKCPPFLFSQPKQLNLVPRSSRLTVH